MEEKEEEIKAKGIEFNMKNVQIEALELQIDSLKASLKRKEIKYKILEDQKKKLQDYLKFLQDICAKKDANLKTTVKNFAKAKIEFKEKLKTQGQTMIAYQTQASKLIRLLIESLKGIRLNYWGKLVSILDLLHFVSKYAIYCDK